VDGGGERTRIHQNGILPAQISNPEHAQNNMPGQLPSQFHAAVEMPLTR
jgi:hypothetical protein